MFSWVSGGSPVPFIGRQGGCLRAILVILSQWIIPQWNFPISISGLSSALNL